MFLFFVITSSLYAQSNDQLYTRRLIWRESEHVYRYAVEVDRAENGTFRSFLREFTTLSNITINVPAGEYRFRVIPHDILDRPGEGTRWMRFEVRAPVSQTRDAPEQRKDDIEQITEQITEYDEFYEEEERAGIINTPFLNTLGVSAGTSFIDPLIVATIHGTFSPIRNFYFQLGIDAGFLSIYKDVESFYCLYPFINAGFYHPLNNDVGFFAGVGIGYLFSSYSFEYVKFDQRAVTLNATAGVNLWSMINIAYTLKTEFNSVGNLLSIGYVYRFRNR